MLVDHIRLHVIPSVVIFVVNTITHHGPIAKIIVCEYKWIIKTVKIYRKYQYMPIQLLFISHKGRASYNRPAEEEEAKEMQIDFLAAFLLVLFLAYKGIRIREELFTSHRAVIEVVSALGTFILSM